VKRGEAGARRTEKSAKGVRSDLSDADYDAFAVMQVDIQRLWWEIFPKSWLTYLEELSIAWEP
jgi:hypothetical protein